MTIRDAIAARLREARYLSGLTLRDVAAEIEGMSYGTVWNYERGNNAPTVEALILLAEVYEREISWFLPEGTQLCSSQTCLLKMSGFKQP